MKDDKRVKISAIMKLLSSKNGIQALLEFAKSDDNAVELFEATLEKLQKSRN